MATDLKTWTKDLFDVTGSALAGPAGALIGSLAGGLVSALLPGACEPFGAVFNRAIPDKPDRPTKALFERLDPIEKRHINLDLQTALRDALREAIYDLGGERCFPQVWGERPRQVPDGLIFLATPQGDQLWQEQADEVHPPDGVHPHTLAEQVCHFFKEMLNAIAEQRLLPLEPSLDQLAVRGYRFYSQGGTPQAICAAFFNQAILPFIHSFGTLIGELPDLEAGLRRDLIDRALIHLGETLKAHAHAWSAYNRLALEALRSQINRIDAAQTEILALLDGLLEPPDETSSPLPGTGHAALNEWADSLADLLAATGSLAKPAEEGFEAVLTRLGEQKNEPLATLHRLLSANRRIQEQAGEDQSPGAARAASDQSTVEQDRSAGRFLRLLDDGSYVVEGAPPVALDESPEPGLPPFKGLPPYSTEDADRFFGREHLTARLAARLRPASPTRKGSGLGGNFLAVIGASGCGKTSLVRAGLIPALQRGQPLADGELPPAGSEHWQVHFITPTEHPLHALADSLVYGSEITTAAPNTSGADHDISAAADLVQAMQSDADGLNRHLLKMLRQRTREESKEEKRSREQKGRLLLVVDQFEELFTLCRDQAERKAFLDNLLAAIGARPPSALVLIIILRADFYARCMDDAGLRQAVASRQEYIGPLSDADLFRAIEQPASRGGWEFERGLLDWIKSSVLAGATQPARYFLPELSHALLETWKHRRGRVMTLESYAESGGVSGDIAITGSGFAYTGGAIAKTADTVFQQFDSDQRAIARNIFLQLTVPLMAGEEAQDACRRALLPELADTPGNAAAAEGVLQALAEAGLIRLGQGSAEIAHDALIHAWPTLHTWLGERRESLLLHRQITADAQEWRRLDNAPAAVYRGARLAQAREWAEAHADMLGPQVHEFLEFSDFVAQREAARSETRLESETEAARQRADEAEARRAAEAERRQTAGRIARRQRMRSFVRAGVSALIFLAAILALVFAGASRQQKARADHRAETALQNQASAQTASTQAVAAQINALAQAHARATAEANALDQKDAAEAARLEAQRQGRISLARELAALSTNLAGRDTDRSLLLAVEAVEIAASARPAGDERLTPVDEAQTALFHALQAANFSGVLHGHTDEVLSAAYGPDNPRILTTGKDGTARLWDSSSREPITIRNYTGGITSAAFSPDGMRILTTGSDQGQDGVAELWELNGSRVAACTGHAGIVYWGGFSPDGTLIVTAGQDKTARLWKADCTPVATLSGHTNAVTAAIFSPDRSRLLTLSADATARLWTPDGSPVATLSGHTQPILGAGFNPDSSRMVTASADGTARLWLADGTPVATLEGHTGQVYSAVFSNDGQRVLTASADGTARLWRGDGSPLAVLGWPLSTAAAASAGSSSPIYMAIFDPDGTDLILTAGADATARLWRADGSLIATLTGHTGAVYSARFSQDGRQIVTASADQTARVWDIDRLYASPLARNALAVAWAGYSPDGKQVLTAGLDGVARLYRLDGNQQTIFTGHTGSLTHAGFSPDGQIIATASRDGTARLWRTDGTFLVELQGHKGPLRSVSFSPDSKLVVTASQDGTARLYRVSGSLVLELEGLAGEVWSAFFSPDGSRIVTASQDGTARIWSAADGQLLRTIDNNQVPVNMAAFSPDGQMVITAGQDGSTRLWLADGTPVLSLEGHTDMVNWAAFSPDGRLIATAGSDGAARLWSMDGKFLASVEGHNQTVTSVGFSPDGFHLITASWDGTVRLWSVFENLEAMQAEAVQRVGRWLTEAECQRYLHQETCPPNP